jgi:hypothetical protein
MVLAIAALFLQLAPTVAASPDTAVTPFAEVSASSEPLPAQPADLPDAASIRSASTENAAPTMTAISMNSGAQNSQSLSTLRVPDAPTAKPERVVAVEGMPSRKSWLILSIAEHSAATFDAYSTRQAVETGAVETDPFLRPFAHSDAIYAAIQVGPAILDYVSHRMQRSDNNFLRRTWWVPQSASTGLFLFSGVHNMNIANR